MTDTATRWIDVSGGNRKRFVRLYALGGALLIVATLAFAARGVLCQLQAYTLLALGLCTLAFLAEAQAVRSETLATAVRTPYCLDCKGTTRAVIVVSSHTRRVKSNYERMFARQQRVYLLLTVWLAWIAYGSLFHSAGHTDAEDSLISGVLVKAWSHWNADDAHSIIASLRTARVAAMALAAFYSVHAERTRGSHASLSTQLAHWSVKTGAVFFLSLFAPTADSTAQTLDFASLLSRTLLFFTLFVLSENLSETLAYRTWVREFSPVQSNLFSSLLMSLGQSAPVRPSKSILADEVVPPDVVSMITGRRGSRATLSVPFVDAATVVRSAWVLFADDSVAPIGLVFACYMLFAIRSARTEALQLARASTLLRVRSKSSARKSPTRRTLAGDANTTITPNRLEGGLGVTSDTLPVDKSHSDDECPDLRKKQRASTPSSLQPRNAEKRPERLPEKRQLTRSHGDESRIDASGDPAATQPHATGIRSRSPKSKLGTRQPPRRSESKQQMLYSPAL